MKHVALVRSIAGTNGDHGRATYQLQTSYNASVNLQHPGIGSVVVASARPRSAICRPTSRSAGQAPKAGYLGQKCEAYYVGRPGEKDPYLEFPSGISQVRGNKRLDILARMNQRQGEKLPQRRGRLATTSPSATPSA